LFLASVFAAGFRDLQHTIMLDIPSASPEAEVHDVTAASAAIETTDSDRAEQLITCRAAVR
jgi:hypothetical protein